MKTTRVFDKMFAAYMQHPRYISSCGGARSSKTFSALELLYYLADKHDGVGDVTSVVSETFPHLKRGAIRDFKTLFGESWDESRWSRSESIYTLPNGAIIEFFSADAVGKVHGPQRKRLFVNEVQNVDKETLRQLAIRTKELIIVDYNPTHSFFVNEEIEQRADCISIHSTYLDNQFLSPLQVAEIEANRKDENWWRVYGEGKIGQLEGVIYDFEQIDTLPDPVGLVEVYGLDFGFTADPTAMDHILIDTKRKILYVDEVVHARGMLNDQLAQKMQEIGIDKYRTQIFADCAEPKTIADLCRYGYNVKPCYKATRKAEQIQMLKGYTIKVTKRSLDWIAEAREYTWQKDKDGKWLNEPIGVNDHHMDAFRYGAFTWISENRGKGQYNIGFR